MKVLKKKKKKKKLLTLFFDHLRKSGDADKHTDDAPQ